jgi:hypothetical protein
VAVEVEDVVEARPLAQVLAQPFEGGRTEQMNAGGDLVAGDELDQGAGDGAVGHVLLVGAGGDQQDVDAVARQIGRERRRIAHGVESALDLAELAQGADARIVQRLPRPGEDARVVAADLEAQPVVPFGRGGGEKFSADPVAEQGLERRLAPGAQGAQEALGAPGFWGEGVFEEVFEIPPQLGHQVALRPFLDREALRGRDLHRRGPALAVLPEQQEPRRIVAGGLTHHEQGHAVTSP